MELYMYVIHVQSQIYPCLKCMLRFFLHWESWGVHWSDLPVAGEQWYPGDQWIGTPDWPPLSVSPHLILVDLLWYKWTEHNSLLVDSIFTLICTQ